MSQKVRCPDCSKIHSVTPQVQGRKVGCKCGKVFRMPGEKIGPARLPKEQVKTSMAGPPRKINVFCNSCGAGYKLNSDLAGQSGKCACGATFLIPHEGEKKKPAPAPVSPPSDPYADPYAMPGDPFADDLSQLAPDHAAADPLAMDFDYNPAAPPAPQHNAPQMHNAPQAPPSSAPPQAPYGQPPMPPVDQSVEVNPIAFTPPPAQDPLAMPGGAQAFGATAPPPPPAGGGYWNRPASANPYGAPQKKSRRDAYKKNKKKKRKRHSDQNDGGSLMGLGNIGFGLLIMIASGGFTYMSYAAAGPGEEYWILYGPFIWGGIHFVSGLLQVVSD